MSADTTPTTRTGERIGRLRCADLWAGAATATVGVVALAGSWSISAPSGLSGLIGPREGPLTVSILLIALGALLIARSQLRGRFARADVGRVRVFVVVAAAMGGFALLFEPLGFVLSATLMLVVLYHYLGERRLWLIALVALSTSVVLYLGFSEGLGVGLPPTPFGF